jgi:pyruvate,water dikinase
MKKFRNILKFNEIGRSDIFLVGGKGASLGELFRAGIPVPPGFVVSTDVYRQVYSGNKYLKDFQEEILSFFDGLKAERVAIRSSATIEDSPTFSWAGQLESYLNVKKNKVLESVKMCWESTKSPRAIEYAKSQNISSEKLLVAVVVQTMVDSEISGIIFSVNPINKERGEIMIEAGRGLGEMIVQGMITPANFVVKKETLEILSKNKLNQQTMLIYQDEETKEVTIPNELKNTQLLQDNQIEELARLAIEIENHYGTPQDIEWAFAGGKFYILQSRPITTL